MANKSVEVILGAVKSAGEAALRLHEENDRLRGQVSGLVKIIRNVHGRLLDDRIDAALAGAADQPSPARVCCVCKRPLEPCTNVETCPTYYDGCNCTTDNG